MSFSLSPDRDLIWTVNVTILGPSPSVRSLLVFTSIRAFIPGSLDDYDSFSLFRASPSQALAKDAFVSVGELNRYMGNFAPRNNEMVPYVDRPYQGPPPFPFQ